MSYYIHHLKRVHSTKNE